MTSILYRQKVDLGDLQSVLSRLKTLWSEFYAAAVGIGYPIHGIDDGPTVIASSVLVFRSRMKMPLL